MIYLILLNGIFLGFNLIVIVFATYYFQIKEYRLDRLISAIREQGFLYFLIPERLLVPKKSVRNFNIVVSSTILIVIYFILEFFMITNLIIKALLIVFSPLVTLVFIIIGVLWTGIISKRNRNVLISQAQSKRNKSNTIFIGITGSYGKSSTKEYLYTVLSTHFKTGKTSGNQNTNIGVAMSVNQNLQDDTKYFVTEMGAYKKGEIREITSWIKPSYAIITGLSNQHLSLFGSIENLVRTKAELIESLSENATVLINIDSSEYEMILKYISNKNVITYSAINKTANIFVSTTEITSGYTNAKIIYKNEVFNITTKLLGKHNLINLLPVIALSSDLGVPKDKIIDTISQLTNPFGKLSTHYGTGNRTYIYDGYSTNFSGFVSAIDTLVTLDSQKSNKKVIVTKGIIELGKEKTTSYNKILEMVINNKFKLVTSDLLFKKLVTSNYIEFIKSERGILEYITSLPEHSTVLIEGRFSDKFVSALGIND